MMRRSDESRKRRSDAGGMRRSDVGGMRRSTTGRGNTNRNNFTWVGPGNTNCTITPET